MKNQMSYMNAIFTSFSLLFLLPHRLSPFIKFMISSIIIVVYIYKPIELSAI